MRQSKRRPLHPGEILREQLLADYGLSMNRLARDLRIPVTRVADLVRERRGLSADTALRLARYFRTSPEFWMNLQTAYELDMARGEGKHIDRDVRPLEAACGEELRQRVFDPISVLLRGKELGAKELACRVFDPISRKRAGARGHSGPFGTGDN